MATAEEQYWIDRSKAEQAQRDKEEKAASGPAGTATSVLSMLASAGGAIPGLLRQPEEGYLRQAQQGQGAGASLARRTASEAARRVAGNVQGADLREGLRAADRITAEGAAQASTIGAQEALAATNSLRAGTFARRRAGQRFGAGIGMGLAGIGATLAAAKDQGPEQPATEPVQGQPGVLPPDPTGLEGQAGIQPDMSSTLAQGQAGLNQLQSARQQALPQGPPAPAIAPALTAPAQPAPQQPAQPPQQPQGAPQQTQAPYTPQSDIAGSEAQYDVPAAIARETDPKAELARSMMTAEEASMAADAAAAGYMALFSGDENASAAAAVGQDPQQVADYIYNEAMNYNPVLKQGLDPWEAAKMLMMYGLPVDWARLGIYDISGAATPAQPESRPQ